MSRILDDVKLGGALDLSDITNKSTVLDDLGVVTPDGVEPGGLATYVQFNDGGGSFGGVAGLTYNKTTGLLATSVIDVEEVRADSVGSVSTAVAYGHFADALIGNLELGPSGFITNAVSKGVPDEVIAGTVMVSADSATVTGIETAFLTDVPTGSAIQIEGQVFIVTEAVSDTELTLSANHTTGTIGPAAVAYKQGNLWEALNPGGDIQAFVDKDGRFHATSLLSMPGEDLTLSGFLGLTPVDPPGAAISGIKLFIDAPGDLSWVKQNGDVVTLTVTGATNVTLPTSGTLISIVDDVRVTFNPGATVAGLNVGALAGDPSTPLNGDIWYDSTANSLDARINGATVSLGAGFNPESPGAIGGTTPGAGRFTTLAAGTTGTTAKVSIGDPAVGYRAFQALQFRTEDSTGGSNFGLGIGTIAGANGATRQHNSMAFGYNMSGPNFQVGDHTFGQVIESFYRTGSLINQLEFYNIYSNAAGTNGFRPFGITINLTTDAVLAAFRAEQVAWQNFADGATNLSVQTTPGASQLKFEAASNITFLGTATVLIQEGGSSLLFATTTVDGGNYYKFGGGGSSVPNELNLFGTSGDIGVSTMGISVGLVGARRGLRWNGPTSAWQFQDGAGTWLPMISTTAAANAIPYGAGTNVLSTSANFNFDAANNSLEITGTNPRIGISTAAPARALHVVDNGQAGTRLERTSATVRTYDTYIASDGRWSIYDATAASDRLQILTSGHIVHKLPNAAPADADLANTNTGAMWLDESANAVKFRARKSNSAYITVSTETTSSGTYSPALTNDVNISASIAYTAQYSRVGNIVTVSGKVDVDPVAPGDTQLRISLPVASAFSATEQCAGTAAAPGIAGQSAAILADVTNDAARMQWVAVDLTSQSMYFTFTYSVL